MEPSGIPDNQNLDAVASASGATEPSVWEVGSRILNTYTVRQIHEGGGMGLVYRVHHHGWNMELAVKCPRPCYFHTENQKQRFLQECKTWVGLGLHPHIVPCHYVRMISGIPCVFAEYVEGGSLHDWICHRTLYRNGQHAALRQILDVAVQMAWGLHSAHEQGIVHQDVKPANVMMTLNGMAKITDFGLAKARKATAEPDRRGPNADILVSSGGMTPAYCSPEQTRGQPLARQTDIWSWAVSVLEMFVGRVCWRGGPAAAGVLADFGQAAPSGTRVPSMPTGLRALLRTCLQLDPRQRPNDLAIVADQLVSVYEDCVHEPYGRAVPPTQSLDADTLNNRAISLIDLDMVCVDGQNALGFLHDLRARSPDHLFGKLNAALLGWRKLRASIPELNRRLDSLTASRSTPHLLKWQAALELEKCDTNRARRLLETPLGGADAPLATAIARRHEELRARLAAFFRSTSRKDHAADRTLLAKFTEDGIACAVSSGASGLVAIAYPERRRVVLKDSLRGAVVADIAVPHGVSHVALSEHSTLLACASKARTNESEDALYRISVFRATDGTLLATYDGRRYDPYTDFKALTIDDDCRCVSVWLLSTSQNTLFQSVFALENGTLQPFRCDFRRPSAIKPFDRVFINGDRTLLMTVRASRCSLWRYPSATQDDGMNVLDIDLADFGLIKTDGHLPRFQLAKGFEYQVDDWNAHDLMNLLNLLPSGERAEYLLCRPLDSAEVFRRNATSAALLRAADAASKCGNHIQALARLDQYCDALNSQEEAIMSRRHRVAGSISGIHVARAWHQEHHNWYWEGNCFGLVPAGDDGITMFRLSGLQTCKLPALSWDNHIEWGDPNPSQARSVGIHQVSDNGVLRVEFDRGSHVVTKLMYSIVQHNPTDIWSAPLHNRSLHGDALNRLVCEGSTVFCGLESDVVGILDLQTGRVRHRVSLGDTFSFMKAVRPHSGGVGVFASLDGGGGCVIGEDGSVDGNWAPAGSMAHRLRPIACVSNDLSSVVGWQGPHRLVHVRVCDGHVTEVWNRLENPVGVHRDWWYPQPKHIALTSCGRAVAYVLWDEVLVVDVRGGNTVMRWKRDWDQVNGMGFDGSGRWLVLAHADNRFEVFQLLWDASGEGASVHPSDHCPGPRRQTRA